MEVHWKIQRRTVEMHVCSVYDWVYLGKFWEIKVRCRCSFCSLSMTLGVWGILLDSPAIGVWAWRVVIRVKWRSSMIIERMFLSWWWGRWRERKIGGLILRLVLIMGKIGFLRWRYNTEQRFNSPDYRIPENSEYSISNALGRWVNGVKDEFEWKHID